MFFKTWKDLLINKLFSNLLLLSLKKGLKEELFFFIDINEFNILYFLINSYYIYISLKISLKKGLKRGL